MMIEMSIVRFMDRVMPETGLRVKRAADWAFHAKILHCSKCRASIPRPIFLRRNIIR
jgi:hypothetical protein